MNSQARLPGAGIRVLVTDDDRDTAHWAAKALQSMGYAAIATNDGFRALALIQSFMPDIVLMDLEMPTLSGFEVARQLRNHRSERSPHLVAFTGWDDLEHRTRAQAAGFEAFLPKPFDLEKVHEVFDRLLRADTRPET